MPRSNCWKGRRRGGLASAARGRRVRSKANADRSTGAGRFLGGGFSLSGDGGGARRCDGAPRRSLVDGSRGRGGDRLRGRAGGGDRARGAAAPSTRAGGTKGRKTRARGGGLAEKCADRAPVRTGGGDGGFGGGRGFGGGGRGGGARGRDRTKASRVVVWGSS